MSLAEHAEIAEIESVNILIPSLAKRKRAREGAAVGTGPDYAFRTLRSLTPHKAHDQRLKSENALILRTLELKRAEDRLAVDGRDLE